MPGGLPDLPRAVAVNRTTPAQQIYNFISNFSLASEPGTRYNYSNLGADVRDRILNVLGMNSTGIAMNSTQITTPLPDELKSRLAKGHLGLALVLAIMTFNG
jgi:CubicO group peptidase (beta-lactamase class C family)